jgi:uncharacterized protein (TIGR02757 family)
MSVCISRDFLEKTYNTYNRRTFVSPDPLQFLYDYEDVGDREIVGLIASTLAYGRVGQILQSIEKVLERLGPSPSQFLQKNSLRNILNVFSDFKHRFTTGEDLSFLLFAVKRVIRKHGSLHQCFQFHFSQNDPTVIPALTGFVHTLHSEMRGRESHVLPSPGKGSACKRLNLFLRWMVRDDRVDPGGWDTISSSKLIIPLDTHMYKIGHALGFTARKQADLKTALEITRGFRKFSPEDPVRYDFSLTRFGIRDDLDLESLISQSGRKKRTQRCAPAGTRKVS